MKKILQCGIHKKENDAANITRYQKLTSTSVLSNEKTAEITSSSQKGIASKVISPPL
jgi:hypothetical protein